MRKALPHSPGHRAWQQFRRDRFAMLGLAVIAVYVLITAGVWGQLWGQHWQQTDGPYYAPLSAAHWLGTNAIGQDIAQRALYSTRTAFEVGVVVALLATLLGAALGAIAGYFCGRWPDAVFLWCVGVLDAMPFYLFVAALAYALKGNPYAMHIAMIATFWTTTARLVRGEVMRLMRMDFMLAARAAGIRPMALIVRHLLPNTTPILLVQGTLSFVAAIKSEVILSFLGLGVKNGVSWGVMIAESTDEVLAGHFANLLSASLMLFFLVMAFNLVSDRWQDALDPRLGVSTAVL